MVSKLAPFSKCRLASKSIKADRVVTPQIKRNRSTEPVNHIPDIAVGLASIPAPMAVPAIIMEPPKREGDFCLFIFLEILNSVVSN